MRILIVEDEEKVSRFIVRGLTAEGFAVDSAPDGPSGLDLATTYDYDLIVLDLMLPALSGTCLGAARLNAQTFSVWPIWKLTCSGS